MPGSFIDQTYGVTGAVTGGFMRGSGTSQATAVMAGAAALVLQQHPTWTNNQVKALSSFTGSNRDTANWSGRMWSGDGWSGNTWSSAGWN